ncbi:MULTISPECIES: VOC family protein [unclassified Streptomyces]|uniref:VOC family protein n=1 Tax=unclassified Streptomyces TaxID=2593676 RepID=UPI002DD7AFE3|nr:MULTISPECIES: VOC family protein [unclassified Streptomyces]WSB78536.1 VOC family protein [Streptomyces sp. NBC_01775]WSS13264.1 VOC family protein [Streptomyces sp. NBC_01186]WSS42051.1 VOC family protein [Streptomyces sp. NBC_01187]
MSRKIFVNLPVKDLDRSVDFFTKTGFEFNPQFTDENASCMVVSENNLVMLLVEPFFQSFSKKDITDTAQSSEVIVALSADSREEVDELVDRALANGAATHGDPQDQGPMYGRSFRDLDGHIWEVMWMDPAALEG